MIATLIGGTGLTGSVLLRRLLADPAITQVISVARRSAAPSQPRVTDVLLADLAELSSLTSRLRGDLFFCCLGTTIKTAGSKENFEKVDHDAVVAFAAIAKASEARSFTLVSAMGANASSRIFYNQVKGRTERDVSALGLRSVVIMRPSLLVGARREFRLAERLAIAALVPVSRILPSRVGRALATDVETLAARMLAEGKAARPGVHVVSANEI